MVTCSDLLRPVSTFSSEPRPPTLAWGDALNTPAANPSLGRRYDHPRRQPLLGETICSDLLQQPAPTINFWSE